MTIKTFLGHSRTIKYAIFLGILAISIPTASLGYFEENFDSYNTGDLVGQGPWYGSNSLYNVSSSNSYSSPNSAINIGAGSVYATTTPTGSTGKISFWIRSGYQVLSGHNRIFFNGDDDDGRGFNIYIGKYTTSNDRFYVGLGSADSSFLFPKGDVWIYFEGDFDLQAETLLWTASSTSWNSGVQTLNYSAVSGVSFNNLDEVELYSYPIVGSSVQYLDNITLGYPPSCSLDFPELCLTENDCTEAGLWWHYNWQINEMECGEYPSPGVCAESTFSCQYCDYSECVALDGCYWADFCYSSEIELLCEAGTQVIFCMSEGDCTTAGGYWYNDQCNYNPAPVFTPWDDYYDEFGDYATATDWINSVASSTGGFLENIGSFMSGFQNFFNVEYAYEKGTSFGSAIPIARGYLEIINQSMFAGYPIGEIFIFVLGFYLAIGVFRMIRNLFALIKFW